MELFQELYEENFGKMPFGNEDTGPMVWHDWLAERVPLNRIRELVEFLVEDIGDSKVRPRLRDLKRTLKLHTKDLTEGDPFSFLKATFCYACGGYDDQGNERNLGWIDHLCRNRKNGKIAKIVLPCKCEVGQELERRSKVLCNKSLQEQIYKIKVEEGREKSDLRKPVHDKAVSRGMMHDINQILEKKMTRKHYDAKWGC